MQRKKQSNITSTAVPSKAPPAGTVAGSYVYDQPLVSVTDAIKPFTHNLKSRTFNYILSLFPILQWIHKYNFKWLYGDLIAGITAGIIAVPQAMTYAKVAGLPAQYGLYSAFLGVMLYCLFATSKDVSIGPVIVMSAQTNKIIQKVVKEVPNLTVNDYPLIASTLSLICGAITLGMGVLRLGFIFEYIPTPAVIGFMTGSAFTISVGQIPILMGFQKHVKTSDPCYLVLINTLKNLHLTDVNAAFGLVSLFVLYAMELGLGKLEKTDKKRQKLWFYLKTLRTALVIIFTTLISWGCYRIYGPSNISILQNVPRGIDDVGLHPINKDVVKAFASELPIATVILVLEHISIAKSFGKINEYRVNPNQEIIAIGVSNMCGHFFNAMPNTGSFGRSAVKSHCGVRTPLSGLFTGLCVLISIYGLTDAFFYMSNAVMAATVVHAVGELISSFRNTYAFFRVSPIEFAIFIADIFLCVFVSLEAGIYFSVAASLVNLLLRQSFPLGEFLGRVEVRRLEVETDVVLIPVEEEKGTTSGSKLHTYFHTLVNKFKSINDHNFEATSDIYDTEEDLSKNSHVNLTETDVQSQDSGLSKPPRILGTSSYTKWWPLSCTNINPDIEVVPPPPGVLVYRFRESLTYQNCSWQTDRIVDYVHKHTKRELTGTQYAKSEVGDRAWNDPTPRKLKNDYVDDNRPVLRALVFDMSCTPNVDLTSVQALFDLQQELSKYACGRVDFHFAGILSEWSRRALSYSSFGYESMNGTYTTKCIEMASRSNLDLKAQDVLVPIVSTNQRFFHFDIPDFTVEW